MSFGLPFTQLCDFFSSSEWSCTHKCMWLIVDTVDIWFGLYPWFSSTTFLPNKLLHDLSYYISQEVINVTRRTRALDVYAEAFSGQLDVYCSLSPPLPLSHSLTFPPLLLLYQYIYIIFSSLSLCVCVCVCVFLCWRFACNPVGCIRLHPLFESGLIFILRWSSCCCVVCFAALNAQTCWCLWSRARICGRLWRSVGQGWMTTTMVSWGNNFESEWIVVETATKCMYSKYM